MGKELSEQEEDLNEDVKDINKIIKSLKNLNLLNGTGKTLLDYTNFISPNDVKNEKVIFQYFNDKYDKYRV